MYEPLFAVSRRVVVGALALSVLACGQVDPGSLAANGGTSGSAGSSSNAAAGSGGANPGATPPGTPLAWSADGFVASATNPYAIEGPFYAYSDCDPPSGLPCTAPDVTLTGADGKPGWSVNPSKVCMKGTAVKVEGGMFSLQWGAGLALDLNSKGGEPGQPAVKATFNLEQAKIKGFSVDIEGTAPAQIRINLTMPGVADSNFVNAQVPGTKTFNVADAKQGNWVKSLTPLDPTHVEAMQFQVFTTAGAPTPYDFCVSAIRVLSDSVAPTNTGGAAAGG